MTAVSFSPGKRSEPALQIVIRNRNSDVVRIATPLPHDGITAENPAVSPIINPHLRKESKSFKPVVLQHLFRFMMLLTGYSMTALFLFPSIGPSFSPIAWASIGISAVLLAGLFFLSRYALIKKDCENRCVQEGLMGIIMLAWPFGGLIEMGSLGCSLYSYCRKTRVVLENSTRRVGNNYPYTPHTEDSFIRPQVTSSPITPSPKPRSN